MKTVSDQMIIKLKDILCLRLYLGGCDIKPNMKKNIKKKKKRTEQ